MNKEMRALAEASDRDFEPMMAAIAKAILAELLAGETGIKVEPLGGQVTVGAVSAPADLSHGFMITFCRGPVADQPE
jgi:hypothetical protein